MTEKQKCSERTAVTSVHVCAFQWTELLHTILHRTDVIIFLHILHRSIIVVMMSI